MKNSNNAKTIASVQNHMVRQAGGKRALFEEMQSAKRRNGSLRAGIDEMVDGGIFLIYNGDIYNFLNRLGYTKHNWTECLPTNVGICTDTYSFVTVRDSTAILKELEQ